MKMLVTGSAGFIFSNVVLHMLQYTKHHIVSVDKLTEAGSLLNISHNPDINIKRHKLHIGDISNYDFIGKIIGMEKPDIIINGAAHSHVDNSIKSSNEFVMSNVVGTHAILEAIRNVHTPKKFIQFSSDEVYGQIAEGSFTEQSPLSPRNPYSATKASADLLCKSYVDTYNLPIIVTRTCNVFGGRQNKEKLIPKCIINLSNNEKVPVFGKGKQMREWIFIKDVCNAIQTIIDRGKVGEVYNIGSGFEIENISLVKSIIDIMGKDYDSIEFVEDRLGHDFRYSLDCGKIMDLDWAPKYNFLEALEYTVGWYLRNRWSWR